VFIPPAYVIVDFTTDGRERIIYPEGYTGCE
jgi:hypothetical protein